MESMSRILRSILNIGCAAESPEIHATRLAIRGNDSQGGGSAAGVDEETDEQTDDDKPADEDNHDLEGDEDDTRSRRSRQDLAYDEIKSDRDRLRNELDEQKKEAKEFRDRLAAIESEKTARQTTNERTNANLELAQQRRREIIAELNTIPADDPERGAKVYDSLLGKIYEDIPKMAEEISRRTSRETVSRERQAELDYAEAKRITLDELEKAGLEPEDFDLVEALAIQKGTNDPGWTKRVKSEDQIPELVGMLKDRFVKTKRGSQEFKDEKDEHRRPMRGVIEKSTTTRRSVRDQDEDDEPQGKGSILADMVQIKRARLQSTNRMLRQNEAYR